MCSKKSNKGSSSQISSFENQYVLTGAVMLETMWATRQQDLLDLISPFVFFAVAKTTSPKGQINEVRILEYVRKEFGYNDMPLAVIEKVFKRNPHIFESRNNSFFLFQNLDSVVSDFERRKVDCEQKIGLLGLQIAVFLENHYYEKRKWSNEDAINMIVGFFHRQGLYLGTNRLEDYPKGLDSNAVDYYIAQYLYEKKASQSIEYEYAIDLVKGYFLQTAIYLQVGNNQFSSSTYKNVSFFYDTPFLLRLLGYKTAEDENSAVELHNSLLNHKGKTFFFQQSQNEINRILIAYKNNIGRSSYMTLEGLDENGYTRSDVDRLINTWQSKLESAYNVTLAATPSYKLDNQGEIDKNYIIDEKELQSLIEENIPYHDDTGLINDLKSIISIHKLRGTNDSGMIENCQYVFVTTNKTLTWIVNDYFKKNVCQDRFPIMITDSDLAALTWIKGGSNDNLPEKQLLRNAYMATQPTPEMLEKFGNVLDKMQLEGRISEELAIVIRSSRYTNKELLFASFAGNEGINEKTISSIEEKIRNDFSNEAREDERLKLRNQRKREIQDQMIKAENIARKIASKEREKTVYSLTIIARIVSIIFLIIALVGLVFSILGAFSGSAFVFIALIVFFVFSSFSLFDSIKGKMLFVSRLISIKAEKKYTEIYNSKKAEYIQVLKSDDE